MAVASSVVGPIPGDPEGVLGHELLQSKKNQGNARIDQEAIRPFLASSTRVRGILSPWRGCLGDLVASALKAANRNAGKMNVRLIAVQKAHPVLDRVAGDTI